MPRNHPSVRQVHAAIRLANGSISEAARALGCSSRIVGEKKKLGQAQGLKYPRVPREQSSKVPVDPTPQEIAELAAAIRQRWSRSETAKRCVQKCQPVEIQSGLTATPAEGSRAGRRPS